MWTKEDRATEKRGEEGADRGERFSEGGWEICRCSLNNQ